MRLLADAKARPFGLGAKVLPANAHTFRFVIDPTVGVGPVRFGMHKDEVSHTFTYSYTSFFPQAGAKVRADQIEVVGLIIYYGDDAKVNHIAVLPRPEYGNVTLELFGEEITHATVGDVVKLLEKRSKNFIKDCYGYEFPDLGIGVWNHDLKSHRDLVESLGVSPK